jgi:hypothetical protein
MSFSALVLSLVALAGSGAHHRAQTDCYAQPARCGYPSAGTTGVPRGTHLKKSRSITIRRDGTVISGRQIEGTVNVDASHVTIRDSLITAPNGGSGSYAVQLLQGADDFRIERSEVRGPSKTNGLESAVWNHYGNPGVTAVDDYFHKCADCWEGPGRFNRDLMVVDAAYPGSHDEDIYVCGAAVHVEHSTLINRHNQTATVFGDTASCGGNRMVITDSLLAGGGYVLYPQGNADSPTGYMKITGNRFARCRTHREFEAGPGGTACAGGPDSGGVFPDGGFYGVAAYYFTEGANIWSGNYWDDNLKPVCIDGAC